MITSKSRASCSYFERTGTTEQPEIIISVDSFIFEVVECVGLEGLLFCSIRVFVQFLKASLNLRLAELLQSKHAVRCAFIEVVEW